MLRKLSWLVAVATLMTMGVCGVTVQAADFAKIEEVVTPKGIKVWLIRTENLPMLSVEVSFRAGAVFEPKGKEGLANLTASLMNEGAGGYDARAFKEELEGIGARLWGNAGATDLDVNLVTLAEHKARAFELLRLALNEPRFDPEAVERMRDNALAGIRRGDEDPSVVAWRMFRPAVYGAHVYANSGEGTLKSVRGLTRADVQAWHRDQFTRANMVISVVGDVAPGELAKLVDEAVGGLPAGSARNVVKGSPKAPKPGVKTAKMEVPQGTVLMGHLGMARDDKDYYAMLVMNEILGGGVLTSRLGMDVRETHGLAYDVRSVNVPMPGSGMFYVSLATDNTKVDMALGLVRKHLNRMLKEQVTEEEFDDAKAYLIGSFPLRLDSNAKLLGMLSVMQTEGLGKDYMDRWPERLAAVKFEDVQRVAKKLIHPDRMVLVVVGDGPALKVK